MKRSVVALSMLACVFFLSGVSTAHADHGGGSSGGCSGDCTPPTLGTDNAGNQIISGGFAVNAITFDVTYFKQDIPTQTVMVGEPVTVTLTIFENSGPSYLRYVGFMMGLEDKVVSGVSVKTHLVQVHWEPGRGADDALKIDDPDGLIRDVSVTESIKDSNNVVTIEFTPVQIFDAGTVSVQTWDLERNVWTNYFYDPLQIVADADSDAGESAVDGPTVESQVVIPEWIKSSAGWWAEGAIDDDTFVKSLQYMLENKIIIVELSAQESEQETESIPEWIKSSAGWWAEGAIDDDTFVKSLQYMISAGIITV